MPTGRTRAIEYAATATRDLHGKRFDHQRRIPTEALQEAKRTFLQNERNIAACRTFDELMNLIKSLTTPMHGLGELYVYDTAVRIGSRLGHSPKCVYLHRGTREGARRLGYGGRLSIIEMRELPEALQALSAAEVEDILCIFKDYLDSVKIDDIVDVGKAPCC